MEENDYLIYADSGAYYINNVTFLINYMRDNNEIRIFTLLNKNLGGKK